MKYGEYRIEYKLNNIGMFLCRWQKRCFLRREGKGQANLLFGVSVGAIIVDAVLVFRGLVDGRDFGRVHRETGGGGVRDV
jgi:hypothetical protein